MSDIAITRYDSNEIAKQDDFNFGEQQCVENLNALLQQCLYATADMIVHGLVVQERGTPAMAVDITAGLAFCQSTGKMAHVGSLFGPVSIANGSGSDRIDTLEIRVKTTTYDTQQRAYRNPTTGNIIYQDWDTKNRYEIEAQVIQGTPGAGVAPNHTTGWIKLAEIFVGAGESTAIYNADIDNVSAGYDGEATSAWTAETTATAKITNWENIKALFRVGHDEDGDHKDDTIKDNHIDWGTGANQVSADDLPIADAGGRYTGTDAETALQEIAGSGRTVETVKGNADDVTLLENQSMFDAVAYDQTTFNAAIERVAANQYKIKDTITSLLITADVLMYGGTSFLSGGDTWGYIQTNNCVHLSGISDVALDVGATAGYIHINTDDCIVENLILKGDITTAVDWNYGFCVDAPRVKVDKCTVRDRKKQVVSTSDAWCFYASSVDSSFNQCVVQNIEITGSIAGPCQIYGFANCENVTSCVVRDFDSDAATSSQDITQAGFFSCLKISDCFVRDLQYNGSSANTKIYGFYTCAVLSASRVRSLNHNHTNHSGVWGFGSCDNVSACEVQGVTANAASSYGGYLSCEQISACRALGTGDYGFRNCKQISACWAGNGVTVGFYNCERATANAAQNCTTGFQNGNEMGFNQAVSCTTKYTNCYAGTGTTGSAANSATGGYNG